MLGVLVAPARLLAVYDHGTLVTHYPSNMATLIDDNDGSMDGLREQLRKLRDDGGGSGKAATAEELPQEDEADAQGGAPPGAGRFGLVRAAAVGAAGPGRDQDLDGIPGAFDVDDNGNLVLDNVDRTARTRQAPQPKPQPQPQPHRIRV